MAQQLVHREWLARYARLPGAAPAWGRSDRPDRPIDRIHRIHRIHRVHRIDRLTLRQRRVDHTRIRRPGKFRAQVPAAVGRVLEQEVLVLPTHRAALQVELRIGRTAHTDQLDALVGLGACAAGIEHTHVGLAVGVALDDQLVGGRTVVAQLGVEQQGATGPSKVSTVSVLNVLPLPSATVPVLPSAR